MMLGFVFVLAFFFQKSSLACFKLKDTFSFFFVSSVMLMLSANFMSISFTSYSPMCIDPRHYLFLIPITAIPASIILTQFIEQKKQGIPILILLAGVSLIAFFAQNDIFAKLYLPITLLCLLYLFLKPRKIFQILFTVVFTAILSLQLVGIIKYAQSVQYGQQKEHIFEQIIRKNEACCVITNEVQKRLGEYYTGFNPNSPVKFITYDEFAENPNFDRKNILLCNKYTLHLSGLSDDDLPYFVKNAASLNKLLFEDQKLGIAIYEMNDASFVDLTEYTVFYTINEFEDLKQLQFWSKDNPVSENIKYDGKKSNKFIEYSATFEYPLNSLSDKNFDKLIIACNLYCYFERATNAQIVITVENENNAYIWRAFGINKYKHTYSNWWRAKCEKEINAKD
jgi:hypothetical protein